MGILVCERRESVTLGVKVEEDAVHDAPEIEVEEHKALAILDKIYGIAVNGNPVQEKSCQQVADEYLNRYADTELAVRRLVRNQARICATSGFVTNIGGLITIPVALPANLTSVLYVQMRMIAIIAAMGGYAPNDDEVKGFAYACLLGTSTADALKGGGVELANKAGVKLIEKRVRGEVLQKINAKLGFRFITKAGTTGIVNLTKLVPLLGGAVGGGVDYATTLAIANKAKAEFITNYILPSTRRP